MPYPKHLITFKLTYFFAFIGLFLVEVFIALYVHDTIIRPFGGDVLVVVLIYAFCMSFINASYKKIAVGVLLFSFLVEVLQAFKLVELLGLQHNAIMRVAIGTSFSFTDLLAYCIGFLVCLIIK